MNKSENKGLSLLFDVLEIAVMALLIATVLYALGFRQAQVDGRSMENTLHHGERLILSNFFYQPQRGDIVVINRYENDRTYSEFELMLGEAEPLVKRVIGVAGDTIRVTTDAVYVNGIELTETYTKDRNNPGYIQYRDEEGTVSEINEVIVPDGCLFVMGDHRDDSKDSRMADIGFVKEENIIGKAIWRLTPFGPLY